MLPNKTKLKLKAGGTVFGCYMRHADPGLAEVVGHLGWDYLLFDAEHSPISERECENLARACELSGATPLVRVPTNQPWMIGRHLDTGMQGVQVPMVESAEQALAVVRAARYQPDGQRGLAAARAARYGQVLPFSLVDYTARANTENMVIVQVETAASVAHVDEIAQVPGVDIVFIGPTDLSQSLGATGNLKHHDVQRAFETITGAVKRSNAALGILVANEESAREWQDRGAQYIMVVLEAILAPAVRSFLKNAGKQ